MKASKSEIELLLNGEEVPTGTPLILENGGVFVPLSALKPIGFSPTLSKDMRTITIKKYGITAVLTFGSMEAKINGVRMTLPHKPIVIKGSRYISAKTLAFLDSNIKVSWDGNTATLTLVDYGFEMITAMQTDDLSKFRQLLISRRVNPEWALENVIYNQKGEEWASAALELVTDALHPDNVFQKAIMLRRLDIVKLMLEKGKVKTGSMPDPLYDLSYIGLAYATIKTYTYDPTGKKTVFKYTSEPSFELAEVLYEGGFRPEPLDAYYSIANNDAESDWLDWMLSHGVDPNGESIKRVFLDEDERNIVFHGATTTPEPLTMQKLIVSCYLVTTWNPSPENLQKMNILVVKHKASLEPLTQAQKNRLLYLANWSNMTELANALVDSGAQKEAVEK
jgi:hypothetical protein